MTTLRINEIFAGVDGECNYDHQGHVSTFIRLAGCNLHCRYCDTAQTQNKYSGREVEFEYIKSRLLEIGIKKLTITGGEPLIQQHNLNLFTKSIYFDSRFCGYRWTLETNGTIEPKIYGGKYIMDYKLPSSGHFDQMNHKAFAGLSPLDFVKFVIGTDEDLECAFNMVRVLKASDIGCNATMAFSVLDPLSSTAKYMAKKIVARMIKEKMDHAVLNLQIHKILDLK